MERYQYEESELRVWNYTKEFDDFMARLEQENM